MLPGISNLGKPPFSTAISSLRGGRVAAPARSGRSTLRAWPAPDEPRRGPGRADAIVAHAEQSISEDAIVAAARERAVDIGAGAVTPAVGALLSVLAKLTGAKAVVEVGTGAGVSGLWLLSGMRDDGVLTTIDVEPEHQRIAKQAFSEAGIGPSRTRLISGRAQEVLTRLADESYDLVFIDADPLDQPHFVVEGVRLLRSGGAIVVHRAALGGRAGDAERARRRGRRGPRGGAADRRGRAAHPGAGTARRRPARRRPRLTFSATTISPSPRRRCSDDALKCDIYGFLDGRAS